jgi:hypothetical protein
LFVEKLFVGTSEAAAAIPVSRRTFDQWRMQGVIPYLHVGGVIRYDLNAVKAALEKRHLVKESANVKLKEAAPYRWSGSSGLGLCQ